MGGSHTLPPERPTHHEKDPEQHEPKRAKLTDDVHGDLLAAATIIQGKGYDGHGRYSDAESGVRPAHLT